MTFHYRCRDYPIFLHCLHFDFAAAALILATARWQEMMMRKAGDDGAAISRRADLLALLPLLVRPDSARRGDRFRLVGR